MSIASRIETITGHITDIYDTLELGGDTTQNKNIVNINTEIKREYKDFLANGTDTLWNNWEKVSGTGETLSLTPTIKGRIQTDLKGNTQQNGTPTPDSPIPIQVVSGDNTIKVEGKNLFDLSTLFKNKFGGNTTSDKGITFTNNNGTINLNGTSTGTAECIIGGWNGPAHLIELDSSQTYTLKIFGKEKSGNTVVCGVDIRGIKNGSASKIIYGSDNTDTIELTGWSSIVYIDIYTQYTSGAINKNISIQLVKGSTIPTTYTPYVSQTYPITLGNIELCKIGTYQDKIAKSTGKNLVETTISNSNINSSGVLATQSGYDMHIAKVVQGETYTITSGLSASDDRVFGFFENYPVLNSTTYNQSRTIQKSDTITAPITGYMTFRTNSGYTTPMANTGSTALPYEPYGTSWYLNKQIGKVVLDGSESGGRILDNNQRIAYNSVVNPKLADVFIDTPDSVSNLTPSLSTHFSPTMQGRITATNNSFGFSQWGGQKYIYISAIYDNIEDFKTWLSTHNILVYYVLATPTTEEITDSTLISQLEALAYSYEGTTNVSQVNDDLAFVLDITALKEMS